MKTQTKTVMPLTALFVFVALMTSPVAFAENSVTIVAVDGSSVPGCEDTPDGCFIPSTATVDVGGVVIFSNPDNGIHTFTSGALTDDDAGSVFDTSMLQPDQSFEWSPDTVGEYPYFCMLHPWMQGVLIVQEANTEPAMETTQVWETEQLMAEIVTSEGKANEPMSIDLTITDLDGNWIQHFTYNIKATQGSEVVLDENGHMHQGTITNNHVTSALPLDASETMPVVITAESVGFGHDTMYVDHPGEIATKQVVPEFGTIAMMILFVAIISIVVITAKTKLSVMPRI